jgi:hypothetical protein
VGLAQRQQWQVVTLLDSSRRHQQSLFHPTAMWMHEIVYQKLQVLQGLCEVHGEGGCVNNEDSWTNPTHN